MVGFNAFKERFTSRVRKERPDRICVDYVEGPLKYLHNEWKFERADDGGTNVSFSVDFAFKSRIFETLAGSMFDRALRRMTNAFEQRAARWRSASRARRRRLKTHPERVCSSKNFWSATIFAGSASRSAVAKTTVPTGFDGVHHRDQQCP